MKKFDKSKIEKIAEKYGLRLLILFCSQAGEKKHLHAESDFDVAYLGKKDLDLEEEAKLISDMMPVFQSEKVDLANLKKADPLLLKQIFEDHELLYSHNPNDYYRYKVYSERKFKEASPLFELREYLLNRFLEKHA